MALIENLELMKLLLDAKANMEAASVSQNSLGNDAIECNDCCGGLADCIIWLLFDPNCSSSSLCFANANCRLKHSSEQGR